MDDITALEKILLLVIGGFLAIAIHDIFSMGDENDWIDRIERWLKR